MPTSLWKFGGLSAKELGQRVYQRLLGDDVLSRAAALAYYFLLSIFPFLLFLTSVLGLVLGGRGELYASLMEYLETAMPQAGFVLLENIMEEVRDAAGGGKLAAGLAGALWAGSLGILAIMSGLNSAYRVEDTRPWWRARLLAIGMTVGFALFVFLGLGLLLFGGRIGTWLAEQVGLGEAFATVWRFLHWPLVLFLVLIALGLIYRFAPDLEGQRWHWITPGAAIALGLWMLASGGLRIYLNFFDNYSNVSDTHHAVLRRNWKGDSKTWLLTAFEKRVAPPAGRTMDISGTPGAQRDDTAPPPSGGLNPSMPEKPSGDKGSKGPIRRFLEDESGEARFPVRLSPEMQAAGDFFRPAITRIARQGEVGARLARRLQQAADLGEVEAGKRLARLADLQLDKLSREDRFHLVEVLEGRAAPESDEIAEIAAAIDEIRNELAQQAHDIGVTVKDRVTVRPGDPRPITLTRSQHEALDRGEEIRVTIWRPFRQRRNWFRHVIRSTGELKTKALRRDIIENLVRLRAARDAEQAERFLDDYIEFIDKGGRVNSLIRYLIHTGQARNDADAFAMLNRFRRQAIRRQGSLEYSREVNLPFWDPDPARVLPREVADQSIRLIQIAALGQHNEFVKRAIKDIHDAGGDFDLARKAVDTILGKIEEGDSAAVQVSRFIRTVQGFKLGLASIANATQGSLNTMLAADLQAVLAGFRGITSEEGRRFGLRSGATLESIINESARHAGSSDDRMGHALGQFLKATGFSATERYNRIFAASAGANYAGRLLAEAERGDKHAARRLAELGIAVEDAIERGGLTPDEVLMAAKKFSDLYGSLGALIILMLWFYLTGLAILVGGEVNSVIENAAAEQGEPGARRPGQKRPELQSV